MQPWSSSVFGIGDGDSFSTQSTARSYPEVSGQGGNNNLEQNMFSAQSGNCVLISLQYWFYDMLLFSSSSFLC